MLFHVSIEADDPRRFAEVVAELWGGAAAPFPPVTPGSWIALAGDERGSAIEFYPRGTEIHETPGDHDATGVRVEPRRFNATHFAMATKLSQDEVLAICAREGCQMIEVLTDEMQAEYVAAVTIDNWRAMLRARELPIAA